MTQALMINGILLYNKAKGISSNLALQKLKRLFGATKAGHTGSLDPLATGMLPICLGEATKICAYLLEADKSYETTGLLGIKTSTADAAGEVLSQMADFSIQESELIQAINKFKGKTQQIPSMYSALKHKGQALYTYARRGIEIERAPRDISISSLQLTSFDGRQFSLSVRCSKGTYIRNLVEDIGETLNVGAHVVQLHRTSVAGFEEQPMYSLDELLGMSESQRCSCLIPMDQAVDYLESLVLSLEEVIALRQGRVLYGKSKEAAYLRLYDEEGKFIGLGERQMTGELRGKRLLAF